MQEGGLSDVAVVVGAALMDELRAQGRFGAVIGLSRPDLKDGCSIARAADHAAGMGTPAMILMASGLLHGPGVQPEKTICALEAAPGHVAIQEYAHHQDRDLGGRRDAWRRTGR